jgi:outer membrane protein assembly factor BamB
MKGQRMRCPNPICRVVFEVQENKSTPEKTVERYQLEGEPPPAAPVPPPETKKPGKTGTVSDVVPLLDASPSNRPSPVPQDKTKPPPKNGDAAPPAPQRVASWRDEPPERRNDETKKLPELGEKTGSQGNRAGNGDATYPPELPAEPDEEMAPASASDYVPPDAEPDQRELDSLETVTPPRSRKALIAALVMLAGVLAMAVVGTVAFIAIFVDAETRLRARAEKEFEEDRYNGAETDFEKLVNDFPKSDRLARYQFLLELSKLGRAAQGLPTAPKETLKGLQQFANENKDNPLLKENQKHVGSILRKIADQLGEFAETNKDLDALDQGHWALTVSDEYSRDDAEKKSIAEKLDQLKIKIVRDLKRIKIVDQIQKLIADGPSLEKLKVIRQNIRFENLEDDPEVVAKLKEVDAILRSQIVYVETKDAPTPLRADPIEPSLLVIPFTSASPRPNAAEIRVVLALDRGVLYAFDQFSGQYLWATRVGIDTTALPVRLLRTTTSPEMFLVLSADRNTLMALAAIDGGVVWRHKLSNPCLGRPVVVDQRAYVTTFDGRVNEIEINRGMLLGYFDLKVPLSLGAVLQEGTDCLYVPGDSDNVYALDLARTPDPNKPARKKACIGILNTGHPSGSLRSEPLVFNHFDPLRPPPGGAPAPGYLVLSQTAGFEQMKLRVFGLPIDSSDAPSLLDDKHIHGWSWFEPCHDSEKFAFITDAGYVGLFGVNQYGNQDEPIYPLRKDEIRIGATDSHLVRGQVVYASDKDFWIVAGGRLQRYYFDLFGQKLLQSAAWPKDGVPTGSPLHAGQMDEGGHVLTTVTRDLSRQVTLATGVDPKNGKILWQRQIGIDSLGDPVPFGDGALIVDRNGAILFVEGGRDRAAKSSEWQLGETFLADQIEGLVPGTVQMVPDGPTTVHEIATVAQANSQGHKLVVRTIRAGQAGQKPTVEINPLEAISSLPQGTADILNGALIIPLADKSLHQFKLPLTGDMGRGGPDWRFAGADDDARGHVIALKGDDLLSTDGSRRLTRWTWPATGLFVKNKQPWEMAARIVTAPLVIPGETENEALRICVADAQGTVTLLNAEAPNKNERTWQLPGKITAGPFARGRLVYVIADRKKLFCIDPAKDNVLWNYEIPNDEIVGQPCLVGDMIVVASQNGKFVGLDPRNGQQRGPGYVLNASAAPTGTPVAAGPETALVPLTDGTVFFLSLQLLQDRQAVMLKP